MVRIAADTAECVFGFRINNSNNGNHLLRFADIFHISLYRVVSPYDNVHRPSHDIRSPTCARNQKRNHFFLLVFVERLFKTNLSVWISISITYSALLTHISP